MTNAPRGEGPSPAASRLRTPPASGARGYSLVEILVAAGLLGALAVAVAAGFTHAAQSVRSGRETTRAVSLGKSVMELAGTWPYEKVYRLAGAEPTDETASWSTDQPNPPYSGDDAADLTATADEIRAAVEQGLPGAVLTYTVEGVAVLPSPTDDGLGPFNAARFIRVSVRLSWTEPHERRRSVLFEELVL